MFFFVFVFFLTLYVCYSFASIAYKKEFVNRKESTRYALCAMLILFLFLATRYDVGRDFQNYFFDYSTFSIYDYGFGRRFSYEYMNFAVLYICYECHTGPIGYFAITSLFVVAIFYLIYRNRLSLLPYAIIIFFLCGFYNFAINGIRQSMAMICVIYALIPSKEKDKPAIYHYVIWMGIAFICHNSSALCFPLYFLYMPKVSKIFTNWVLILIVIAGFVGNQIGLSNLIPVELFADSENIYMKQAENATLYTEASQLSIAVIVNLFAFLIPLYFVDKVEEVFPESKIYFIIFSFGTAIYYFVGANLYLIRLSYYLSYFNILVYPYLYLYFLRNKKLSFVSVCLNIWFAIYFVGKIWEFWDMQIGRNPSIYGISF